MENLQAQLEGLRTLVTPVPAFHSEAPAREMHAVVAGERSLAAAPIASIPTSIAQLGRIQVQSYDLSVTAAANLSIPVIGTGGGSYSRRIVVLEQSAYREVPDGDTVKNYGYAVRFCVTVNKWDSNLKLSLPFLAASAEVGSISAQWMLQILGLAGPKINEALLPPTELSVEKFVLAKQSLEKIITAIQDPATVFQAEVVGKIDPADKRLNGQRIAVAETYALSSIERGRSLFDASRRAGYDTGDSLRLDAVRDIYRGLGIADDNAKPSDEVRRTARDILEGIKADV